MDLTSNFAYWPIQNGLIRAYPALDEDMDCDVVVIGAGITGALVAYHLAEAGIKTIVLDRRHVGWGSTSATTALLQYEIDTPLSELVEMVGEDHAARSYKVCLKSIHKIGRLAHKLDELCGFERKKSLYLASNKRAVKELKAEHAIRNKHGIRVDWLDPHHLSTQFGLTHPAALLSHDAAQIDAYRFTHQLLHKASGLGAQVFDRTTVTKFDQMDSAVHLSTDRNCTVRTKKVVFATGYESQQYLKQQVAKLISTFAFVSEPVKHSDVWPNGCLIWESARPYVYLRTTEDNRIIMGGEDEAFRNPLLRDKLVPRKTEKLLKKFGEMFPRIKIEVAFAWAGTFGETKDGLAYIGETEEFPHAYFALGYGGNGITYSVVAAEIIRDAMLGKQNNDAELFRFDR